MKIYEWADSDVNGDLPELRTALKASTITMVQMYPHADKWRLIIKADGFNYRRTFDDKESVRKEHEYICALMAYAS